MLNERKVVYYVSRLLRLASFFITLLLLFCLLLLSLPLSKLTFLAPWEVLKWGVLIVFNLWDIRNFKLSHRLRFTISRMIEVILRIFCIDSVLVSVSMSRFAKSMKCWAWFVMLCSWISSLMHLSAVMILGHLWIVIQQVSIQRLMLWGICLG